MSSPDPTDVPDAHLDVWTATEILLECLAQARKSKVESAETRDANTYLYERLMNYRVMMRRRELRSTYEFIATLDGKAGWYYQGHSGQANWVGPFASRKAAVDARGTRPGTKKKFLPIDMMDKEIFGAS